MKKPSISNALVGLCLFLLAACQPPLPKLETKPELGLQTWTFRKLTLVEAIAKASQLGIHTIEAYPGQKLGGGIEGNLTPDLESEKLAALKKILAENKVSISGFGVIMQATEEEWKQLFAFAKSLGIHWISSEPPADMLPAIATMAKESGVRVAIHNHPLPSRYYDPVALLKTIEPYGPEIGLCADTGHWARSGLNPLEKLRLALPRVVTVHFKDLNEWTKQGKDQPWGTGVSDAAGMLAAIRQAGFAGVVLMEYENDSDHLLDDLQRCAEFFRSAMDAPLEKLEHGFVAPPRFSSSVDGVWADNRGADGPAVPQWNPLFTDDLSNAECPAGSWSVANGILKANGTGATLWTKKDYGDVSLTFEFRVGENANSGVFLRCTDTTDSLRNAIEVEISQPGATEASAEVTGSLYNFQKASPQIAIKPGEWHNGSIFVQGQEILVVIDGQKVNEANLRSWTTARRTPDGSSNPAANPLKDPPQKGRIGLQDFSGPIEFRNLSILEL